jgi:hypothetical protein
MKANASKNLRKRTNTIYRYHQVQTGTPGDPTVGDPTNTTITILTTVSAQMHQAHPDNKK